ncbi:MAG: hypothetical protein C0467_29450 [Planctomycetaceae bacterium]|nr:hypothetical protein [Planctomycetaceae bacterium]
MKPQTPMTHPRFWITFAALLLVAVPASAADYPVKITAARVGLPPGGKATDRDENGQAAHVAKFACWAPVYVDLDLATSVNDQAELVIEAADPDEIATTLAVPLNLAGSAVGKLAAVDVGCVGYVRPAGVGEVTITIRTKDGKALSEPFRVRSLRPRDPLTYVVLSLGGPLSGFDLPKPSGAPDAATDLRGGRVELTTISDVAQLPDRWVGYETADLVILNTAPGSDEFLRKLFGETSGATEKAKRAALLEWLRRGGRLVVTVGANAALVSQLPALRELLPLEVKGTRTPGIIRLSWPTRAASQTSTMTKDLGQKGATFPVANLLAKADRSARILMPLPDPTSPAKEIIAGQSAFGLGKVTVIGLDLDRAPFTEFPSRPEFWDWVLYEGGANRASGGDGKARPTTGSLTEDEDEAAVALRTHIDTFDGVPVVSFGWVAMLIVFYILLIGPVEYYFLKRVLGRLELTWITFPIIVLTVSLAAYFSAYSLKGRDLKINKIDLVDVDPASGRVYGTTWFTVFSPRIDTYTIGVTPGDGWGDTEPGTAVSWVGAPRGGRASLLRRKYSYHTDAASVADGLEKVPVQVWGTKSFGANWSGGFNATAPTAIVRSELLHPPGDANAVIGSFTLNLPTPVLSDCVLFYAGQAYPLPGGTVRPGEVVRPVWDKLVPAAQWLQKEGGLTELLRRAPNFSAGPGGPKPVAPQPGTAATAFGVLPPWGILFHEAALSHGEGVIPRNASLRRLDQSWRLNPDNRSEVILVGRVVTPAGSPAEEALSGPDSASRLWLRELPGSGPRTPIPGTGRQETWVRVYLPIR